MSPTIVTGHGRSGTHWLTSVLGHFMDARHEPDHQAGADVVVDCKLWRQREKYEAAGQRMVHLVRDGRDVIRSRHAFYDGRDSFDVICQDWADVVDACDGLETLRLEDLTRPIAASSGYRMAHWTEWPDDDTDEFWRICGDQMRRHGYAR